jgi:hydroxymethylbilane synthase
MDSFRLASGSEAWEIGIASRVQRLMESSGDAPRIASVRAIGGKPPAAPSFELLLKLQRGEADGVALPGSELPGRLPSGLILGAILPDRDALYRCLSRGRPMLSLLPIGSRVAAWDLSARAQILARHPGFRIEIVRGRSDLAEGLRHGLWAAACLPPEVIDVGAFWGLKIETIPSDEILPAAGQGAIALLVASSNSAARLAASRLDDHSARRCVSAERTFVREAFEFPGSVSAVLSSSDQGMIDLNGLIADAEGRWMARDGARAENGFGEIVAREVAEACGELAHRALSVSMPLKRAAAF